MPTRIQLRRTKGWKLPAGAIRVARPSRWGNPFKVGHYYFFRSDGWDHSETKPADPAGWIYVRNNLDAVFLFRRNLERLIDENTITGPDGLTIRDELAQLRGHDLACWCKPNESCHATVLLELANPSPMERGL